MFRVLLVSLHDRGTFGHRCISAQLKAQGYEVHNIFFKTGPYQDSEPVSPDELAALQDLIAKIEPDLIGVNVHSSFGHPLALAVVSSIRRQTDTPIVLGGIHPTILPEYCGETIRADYICVGEGEDTIAALCEVLQDGGTPDNVPGLWTAGSSQFVLRPPRKDLDTIPFQDIGNENKYIINQGGQVLLGDPYLRGTVYETKASRGCPFRCSYCTVSQLRDMAKPVQFYRLRSPTLVVDEIAEFRRLNPACNEVRFWDDTFPFSVKWVDSFAAAYKARVAVPFSIWLNPDTTYRQNISRLRGAGLRSAVIGIESASLSTRSDVFRRTESNDDIVQADSCLCQNGVARIYDLILDHPWESPSELEDTYALLSRLKAGFSLNMHSLVLLPRTELAERAIAERLTSATEVIETITGDPQVSSRRMQWIRGGTRQSIPIRRYWLFLIQSMATPDLPQAIVRWLGKNRLLKNHPELLGGGTCDIEAWIVRSEIPRALTAIYQKSGPVKKLIESNPALKRRLKQMVQAAYWLGDLMRHLGRGIAEMALAGSADVRPSEAESKR